jgi:hypothetical protein
LVTASVHSDLLACVLTAQAARLTKEIQELPANLPLHPNASIFVRFDKTRPDVIRALISGAVAL